MTPRSSVVTILFVILAIVNSRAFHSGPTAQDCRHHIEAAIKEFLEGQSEKTDTRAAYEPYTRTQIEDGYAPVENTGVNEDGLLSIQDDQQDTEDDDNEDEPPNEPIENDQTEDNEDDFQREKREENNVSDDDEEDEKVPSEQTSENDEEIEESSNEKYEPEDHVESLRHEDQEAVEEEDDDNDADHKEKAADVDQVEAAEEGDQQEAADEEDEEEAADERDQKEATEEEEEEDVEAGNDKQENESYKEHQHNGEPDESQTSEDDEEASAAESPEDEAEGDEFQEGTHNDQLENQLEAPPTEQEPPTERADTTDDEEKEDEDDDDDENESNEDRIKRSEETEESDDTANETRVDDSKTKLVEKEDEDDDESTAETQAEDEYATVEQPTSQPKDEDETTENAEADQEGKEFEVEDEQEEEEDEEEPIVQGPGELRTRENIDTILDLDDEQDNEEYEKLTNDVLKEIKRMYEGAVRPLEQLYKFKDISTRQMGDAEIFSKPMVLFMGPWSTGKSAIINYLLGTEYTRHALKTGAEPTSNSFTVIMYGDNDQVIDGTQLAADWAFSTLQKFGQTFLDRLRGRKMPHPLLKKMTIVDTPGILENRKSTERQYPFNDAFQWFIDRADLIYIVFDPTKLDIGLELEALFDQLKGRENQVRILLNKADIVKPQELMKVQGTLLWNLSPLLGTSEAPTVFVGSLWSRPYLPGSPTTLLDAQEQAFLEDIHEALENRVENKIAQARRHAVRVRNHAKMVDCYLSTYYNHKSFFSNKRKVADDIIDNPQNYHIYEGLSILTNVSRYDLPDPDIYKEFFHIHPLFDFKPLASTCSYFKGCPLDKLDITIAYDLPELVGKYHRIIGNRPVVGGR